MNIPSTLSHAYIITGGGADSRQAMARRMAAAYLCQGERKPCGGCRHCVKVEKGIHPDVIFTAPLPDKREIVVDQTRAIRTDAHIRPNEGERKVYVISPADTMNPAAQNALLKVLEDGPAYTAFLLLAGQPGRLLETIRSRCETVTLPPEEEQVDPDTLARGEELGRLLVWGSEWDIAQRFARLETEKLKGGQLLEQLAAAERTVAGALTENRRAARVLGILKQCQGNGVYNMGTGHILGWIQGELFRQQDG